MPPKQRDDIYIPADLLHDRSDRELELTSTHSTQIGVEHEPKQRRANEHERAPLSASNRRMPPDPTPVAASLTERSTSDSSSSQVAEQSRTYSPAFDCHILHTNFMFPRVSCLPPRMQASRLEFLQ